jgi:hypothetical protein
MVLRTCFGTLHIFLESLERDDRVTAKGQLAPYLPKRKLRKVKKRGAAKNYNKLEETYRSQELKKELAITLN